MRQILAYLKPYIGRISLGVFIKFFGSIMDLLLPWILAYMIDNIVPLKSIPLIVWWGIIMIICSIIAVVTNIMANRMASKVARDTTQRIRHDLFSKISYLSCSQVDDISLPSLISRLTTDTYNIHQMIGMMQRMGIRAPILLLGGIIVTLTLEPVLTLVLLSVLPFIGWIVFSVSKKGIPLYTKVQRSVDQMVRVVREGAGGIRVIKALSKIDYEKNHFAEANKHLVENEKKAGIMMAISNPAMNLFLNLGMTLVILVGAYRVNAGVSEPGKIIAFMTYFTIILNALLSVTRIFVIISKSSASAERICQVLNQPQDLIVKTGKAHASVPEDVHVFFDHVSFAYKKGGKDNLHDISFALKQGETLGIIGETGSGKSTLIQLLMRFYDTDRGHIFLSGQDIQTIPPEMLHTKFGVTFQNDVLFADTIRENISFGRHLTDQELEQAASFAQASEFIDSLHRQRNQFKRRAETKSTGVQSAG